MKAMNFVVSALAVLSIGMAACANAATLADRHASYGAKCESCHVVKTPEEGARVKNEQCLACHGSYEQLAEKTAKVTPNPHDSHLGKVRCSDCHVGHADPKLMCNDCHKFNLKTP